MTNRKQLWVNPDLYLDLVFFTREKGYTIKGFVENAIRQALIKEGVNPSHNTYIIKKGNTVTIHIPNNYGELKR